MNGLPTWLVTLAWVPYYVYVFASSGHALTARYGRTTKAQLFANFCGHVSVETMPVASLGFVVIGADAVMRESWLGLGVASLASCLMVWLWQRNDNDNRWKRRRERLAGAVRRAGNRLSVVWTGGPS